MRKFVTGLLFLCVFALAGRSQSLEEVIRAAQDCTLTAFQSRYEYEFYSQKFAQFEALRKPQLNFRVTPNYLRMAADPARDYVYDRHFNRFSTAANLQLNQKVLGLGGDAYVGTSVLWSEYFNGDQRNMPREFVTMPLVMGYQQSLLGYNPYRWEKIVQEGKLASARKNLNYQLHLIAEEATRRFFRLACAQGKLDMCLRNQQTADTLYAIAQEKASIAMVSLAELRSLELQRLNAANALMDARNEEQLARESLAAYLRTDILPAGSRLSVPTITPEIGLTEEDALELARSNSAALQQQQTSVSEALQQQEKARKERGAKVGVDLNIGMQQLSSNFFDTYRNPRFYMLGAVTLSIPIVDHGAARKGHAAAEAWTHREEQALKEVDRALAEDVRTTLDDLRSHATMLSQTTEAVTLADEVFELTAENYANGLCDINTYSLAQTRRDNAYNQHLTALAKYWTTYYHFLTLTQHE